MGTHMDAYTILYQAREQITNKNHVRQMVEETIGADVETFLEKMNEEDVRNLALVVLEEGIKQIRYEYPPNVSKRMYRYYNQNKDALLEAFSHNVKTCVTKWDEEIAQI